MTFTENGGRPGDERAFFHKSFIGKAIGSVVGELPGIGTAVRTARQVVGTVKQIVKPRGTVPRTQTARVTQFSEAEKELGKALKFGDVSSGRGRGFRPGRGLIERDGCDPPLILNPATGNCIAPTSPRGAELFFGEATMGQYGAALIPGTQLVDRAVCPRGTHLGNDGLCYNKSQITNKQRMWPAGRKPLLSGGDMAAISTAARAGRRMDLATKRLQKMGMMKKPARRGAPRAHQHARPVAAVSV